MPPLRYPYRDNSGVGISRVIPTSGLLDDFAIRRVHVYGTLVLDMVTSKPIDLLADRTADTVADWLKKHPGTEVVCRDRAGAYAEGIRIGAPDAVQVADRWHLWHNLAEAVEKTVARHRADLRLPVEEAEDVDVVTAGIDEYARAASEPIDGRLVTRTRERHAAVRQLASQGMSISAIGRKLSLDRRTVRRFARATEVEELLTKAESRVSLLDEFKPHLHERFNAGCTDAARLTREIALLGYRGSDKTVRRYLQPLRSARDPLPSGPTAPSVRQATGWLTRHPDRLTDDERTALEALLERSPALATTRDLVHDFAEIMVERRGRDLGAWMTAVDANGDRALRSFVTGLRRDLDAVTAGLTLPYSSGPVEGHVNRIILWNLRCQGHSRLRWLTGTIGSRVTVGGAPISRGVVPVGVGTSISRSRRLSRAVCPSSTAARSSSLSGIAASMRWRLSLASNSCPLPDALGA